MRWTAAAVVLLGAGLTACGSGGGGGPGAQPPDVSDAGRTEEIPLDIGEDERCPSETDVGEIVGERIDLHPGINADSVFVACAYSSQDSSLMASFHCYEHESVADAEERMDQIGPRDPTRVPLDVGDESFREDGTRTDSRGVWLSFGVTVRTGSNVCLVNYGASGMPSADPPPRYEALLDYLVTESMQIEP